MFSHLCSVPFWNLIGIGFSANILKSLSPFRELWGCIMCFPHLFTYLRCSHLLIMSELKMVYHTVFNRRSSFCQWGKCALWAWCVCVASMIFNSFFAIRNEGARSQMLELQSSGPAWHVCMVEEVAGVEWEYFPFTKPAQKHKCVNHGCHRCSHQQSLARDWHLWTS